MEFDITKLDKRLLIQSLFAHSSPLRMGKTEYDFRKKMGDNVYGIPDEECDLILEAFNDSEIGGFRVYDYHKGKPMKLVFYKNRNGRILVDSSSYDARNGKYRFLESMLNIFSLDEIYLTKKGYPHFVMDELPEHLVRSTKDEEVFKTLIKNTIPQRNEFGKYWSFDETKVSYTPPFLESLLK